MALTPIIRFGDKVDLPGIVDIYNQAIRSGTTTGDMDPYEVSDRIAWFKKFSPDKYPIYIIEVSENVAGYGTLAPYRTGRRAMSSIVEISFFFDNKYQGMGLGSILVEYMIKDCSRLGKKTLLAILLDVNDKSIGLLQKFGFKQWGFFPDVVEFDDMTCGQLIYGLKI